MKCFKGRILAVNFALATYNKTSHLLTGIHNFPEKKRKERKNCYCRSVSLKFSQPESYTFFIRTHQTSNVSSSREGISRSFPEKFEGH